MTKTSIAWTDETWNPVTGCTKVSAGCKNCYAEAVANRWWKGRKFTDVQVHPGRLNAPEHWRKPRRVFVNSMSDLFHEAVPRAFIDRVFAIMALNPRHTFQVLTKRPERMADYLRKGSIANRTEQGAPLPNVWLGVSCEDQRNADARVPVLLETPAAVRFLSCEPLLGVLNIEKWLHESHCIAPNDGPTCLCVPRGNRYAEDRIDWVIVGGESGPGARSCEVRWIRDIVGQCKVAGVACFVKQLGARPVARDRWDMGEQAFVDADAAGWTEADGATVTRLRDGKGSDPDEWPEELRVQEFPEGRR